jgi:DNA-binding Lrp family transcriptional regulator
MDESLDEIDRTIINKLQYGFPICDYPFQIAAESLDITESELLERITTMRDNGILTRFGPLFNVENMGGTFSLCAMKVPAAEFDSVADQVNALPQVAHNYQRDHALNMWFVLATETLEEKHNTLMKIEQQTGCRVYDMPKEREYFVGLYLKV